MNLARVAVGRETRPRWAQLFYNGNNPLYGLTGGIAVRRDSKRIVAVCHVGSEDINSWMVFHGWAMAYRQYSSGYVDEEAEARNAHKGIWRGEFTPPWEWRRRK